MTKKKHKAGPERSRVRDRAPEFNRGNIQFLPRSADTVCGVVQLAAEADMSARSAVLATSVALLVAACTPESDKNVPDVTARVVTGDDVDDVFQRGDRILFAYDSATIEQRYQTVVQKAAALLAKNPSTTVTIEGHADERGTREYNLALGERRAIAVKHALTAFGVPADRLSTVSYGKERPAVAGSDEAAWSQNRRAVMVMNSAQSMR
jgi:peptidoglycan-associated lipoprotein